MRNEVEIKKRLSSHKKLRDKAERDLNDSLFNHHSKVCTLLEWIIQGVGK